MTKIGVESLALAVIAPDVKYFVCKEGVRHMDDPRVRRDPEAGGWDVTEKTKRFLELERKLHELTAEY